MLSTIQGTNFVLSNNAIMRKEKKPKTPLQSLAAETLRILRRISPNGYEDWQDGNGVEFGSQVERLIRRAKRILNQQNQ